MNMFNLNVNLTKDQEKQTNETGLDLSKSDEFETLFLDNQIEKEIEAFLPDTAQNGEFSLDSILDSFEPIDEKGLNFFETNLLQPKQNAGLFEPDNDYYSPFSGESE